MLPRKIKSLQEYEDRVSSEQIRSHLEKKARREIVRQEFTDELKLRIRIREEEYRKASPSAYGVGEIEELFMHPETFRDFKKLVEKSLLKQTDISLSKYGYMARIENECFYIRVWVHNEVPVGELLLYKRADPEIESLFPEIHSNEIFTYGF